MNITSENCEKSQSVKNLTSLLQWINENPSKHGKQMPCQLRDYLRHAEAEDLIDYDMDAGWQLTQGGAKILQAFN